MFIGREKELSQLENAYDREGFRLFLVYGAKSSGKTTLLEEFCKNKSAIYFTATQASSRANLSKFSTTILKYSADESHEPFNFWDDALKYVAEHSGGYRIIVVIEGFDILAERDYAFMGIFARVLENEFRESNIFLVITCVNAAFLNTSPVKRFLNGVVRLGKFLTDENIARLKEQAVKQTAHQAKFVRVPAERVILREGSINGEMYKIVSGRAICYLNYGTDNEYVLGSLKEGKTFGEYSLLTGKPGIYTVTAYTDMLLMRIERGEFTKFLEVNARNSVEIMQNMASMMNVMKVNIDMMNDDLHHIE